MADLTTGEPRRDRDRFRVGSLTKTFTATGDDYASQVDRWILEPLKLRATSVPGASAAVPRPHGRHYSKLYEEDPNAPVHDVTEFNPTLAWSAGQVPGSLSRAAATRDGRHVLTVNRNGDWGAQEAENAVLEAEFCG